MTPVAATGIRRVYSANATDAPISALGVVLGSRFAT
jgi:hypothetical protein